MGSRCTASVIGPRADVWGLLKAVGLRVPPIEEAAIKPNQFTSRKLCPKGASTKD